MLTRNEDAARKPEDMSELELLREENARLSSSNREAFDYIRCKVNSLLEVVGTKSLQPEELDDHDLVEFDPIGIVAQTFQHVQDNLRQTNKRLNFAHDEVQTVLETVGAAVLVLDPEGKVVSFNQKIRDLMLEGNKDIRGKKCLDHVCQGDYGEKGCTFQAVMQNGREQKITDWLLKGRSFDVIGRPMFDGQGKVTHVVLAYHDVSDRQAAQTALMKALNETREANAKIHGILSSAADGILVTDANNNVVLINRRAEELVGFNVPDHRSPMPLGLIPHEGLVGLLSRSEQRRQETFIEDLSFEAEGQSRCVCQARVTVIKSSDGAYSGCIMLLHDVTEQRTIEQMKDEFISTAAHELRTPLATIIGYTDLMLMDNKFSSEQQADFLAQIQEKAERLGDIVGDLLDISRIESGEGVKLDLKPTRLDVLCEEAVKSFRVQHPSHNFVLNFTASASIFVNLDRYATMQILENLLSNAVKYSPGGGDVGLSARLEGGSCVLSISDHGMGMSADQVARIFDKFYRVDATNTAISGTGLGMTIVKHLVEAQSGEITVTSSLRVGTTVTVRLPVTPVVSRELN